MNDQLNDELTFWRMLFQPIRIYSLAISLTIYSIFKYIFAPLRRLLVVVGIIFCIIAGIAIIIVLVHLGYTTDWTGFKGPQTKTLWDWMQLLIVPIILVIGAFLFNRTTSKTEQKIALEKQQEDLLQTYLDRISELLLKEGLRTSQPDKEVSNVARTRTLSVLMQLDTKRKNIVFSFLRETKLINPKHEECIITFNGADLEGIDFKNVNLSKADFGEATLRGANLIKADLRETNLSKADLEKATLRGANLIKANLRETKLRGANLRETFLSFANFSKADLREANLSYVELGYDGTDFREAILDRTDLRGTGRSSHFFTKEQLKHSKRW